MADALPKNFFTPHRQMDSRGTVPSGAQPFREHALQAGETAPDFELPDSTGAVQRLADLCATNPFVLIFYRGHW